VLTAARDACGRNRLDLKEIQMRSLGRLLMLAMLITGTIVIVLPAAASADARVSPQVPCVSYAGGNFYSGSGTNVITDGGKVILSCHLTLVSGTPVSEPTRSTYGNCDTLEVPSGRAEVNCHYALL
jgi:hypothetical protein